MSRLRSGAQGTQGTGQKHTCCRNWIGWCTDYEWDDIGTVLTAEGETGEVFADSPVPLPPADPTDQQLLHFALEGAQQLKNLMDNLDWEVDREADRLKELIRQSSDCELE